MHEYTSYWDRGVKSVPQMTGAHHLLDARDLKTVFDVLGIPVPFTGHLVDVGCGTGRMAKLCADKSKYWGFDIAPSAIEYCRNEGLSATLISGPSFQVSKVDLLTCISVFTHIDRPERIAYLNSFAVMSTKILVDIIPGDGSGNVQAWSANPDDMVADLLAAGFKQPRWVNQAWDMHLHRYFYAERA